MHVMSALEVAAMRAGMSHVEIARACGVTKQAMSRRFDLKKNVSVGVAAEIAGVLGYELALVPAGEKLPEGSMLIEAALADKHGRGGRR